MFPKRDKYVLCMCPIKINSDYALQVLLRFAEKLAAGEVSGLTREMTPRPARNFVELGRLCSIFNELEIFLWLQHRFPPGNMLEAQAAISRKERAIHLIGEGLLMVRQFSFVDCNWW
jgi:Suv3 C-terminal domain 1/Mitochondrial degradasome RNA helicase subunit C terminal